MKVEGVAFEYNNLKEALEKNISLSYLEDKISQINDSLKKVKEPFKSFNVNFVENFSYMIVKKQPGQKESFALSCLLRDLSPNELDKLKLYASFDFIRNNLPSSLKNKKAKEYNFMLYKFLEPITILFQLEDLLVYRYIKLVKPEDIFKEAFLHQENRGLAFHYPIFVLSYNVKLTDISSLERKTSKIRLIFGLRFYTINKSVF